MHVHVCVCRSNKISAKLSVHSAIPMSIPLSPIKNSFAKKTSRLAFLWSLTDPSLFHRNLLQLEVSCKGLVASSDPTSSHAFTTLDQRHNHGAWIRNVFVLCPWKREKLSYGVEKVCSKISAWKLQNFSSTMPRLLRLLHPCFAHIHHPYFSMWLGIRNHLPKESKELWPSSCSLSCSLSLFILTFFPSFSLRVRAADNARFSCRGWAFVLSTKRISLSQFFFTFVFIFSSRSLCNSNLRNSILFCTRAFVILFEVSGDVTSSLKFPFIVFFIAKMSKFYPVV